MGEGFENLSRY